MAGAASIEGRAGCGHAERVARVRRCGVVWRAVGTAVVCFGAGLWACAEPVAPPSPTVPASGPLVAPSSGPSSGPSMRCGGDEGCMAGLSDDVVREARRAGRPALAGTAEELGVMLRSGRCGEARKLAEQRLEPWVYPGDEALTTATKTLALELVGAECR